MKQGIYYQHFSQVRILLSLAVSFQLREKEGKLVVQLKAQNNSTKEALLGFISLKLFILPSHSLVLTLISLKILYIANLHKLFKTLQLHQFAAFSLNQNNSFKA